MCGRTVYGKQIWCLWIYGALLGKCHISFTAYENQMEIFKIKRTLFCVSNVTAYVIRDFIY